MNPADRERKQMRAKELKRNKKQRNAVRQAIVKSRDPDELIEQMSRLDEQEFDPQRILSLNVIQEKRNKLRASYFQIINLCRQEKEEKKVRNLERMLYEYEVERSRKEENFRAMLFSQSENFEEIPLPTGASAPDAANTPYSVNSIPGSGIGPIMPQHLQAEMKVGILKKPVSSLRKKHKYPPGPPPGLPPLLYASEDEEEDDEEGYREEGRRRRRVRFGNQPQHGDDFDGADEHFDGDGNYEDEDYAPVEIPESMLSSEEPPMPHQQPVYSRSVPSLAAPAIGAGPIMPGMAPLPPSTYPQGYPIIIPPHGMRGGEGGMRQQHGRHSQHSTQQSKTGLVSIGYSDAAVISAEPQVVKQRMDAPPPNVETIITAGPQMRNVKKETTRFVPTAVKIQRPVVPTVVGPKIPTSSVAGPTKLVPRSSQIKTNQKQTKSINSAIDATKSVDEACDDFLKELDGLL